MKIKVDRKAFAQAISEAAPFIPSKPTVMIQKYAKITTKGLYMKVEANSTQNSISKYIEMAECDSDGSFLVDCDAMNKFASKIKGDTIDIEADGNVVKITHVNGTAELQSEDADIYPSLETPSEGVTEVSLDARLITETISKAGGFVMNNETRPQMCAIYAYIENNEYGYCASDTCKMIHGHRRMDGCGDVQTHWLIMPSVFRPLTNACKNVEAIKIQIAKNFVTYRVGATVIRTLTATGAYPNFKRVIPSTWAIECAVHANALDEAVGRVSQFCDVSSCVKLEVSRMDMQLTAENLQYVRKATENVIHDGCDGDIRMGLNAAHFQSCINAFDGGPIVLRMTDASRPVLVTQTGECDTVCVCMPMALVQ